MTEVRDFLGKVYNGNDGPLKQDLEDIMAGILNMQYFYDLKSQDVGRIKFPFQLHRVRLTNKVILSPRSVEV